MSVGAFAELVVKSFEKFLKMRVFRIDGDCDFYQVNV